MVKKKQAGHTLANGQLSLDQADILSRCQQLIDYQFKDTSLLLSALTHSSSANHKLQSSERLEFLGDSLLGAVVCEFLFHRFPSVMEGELTKIKSVVVSGQTCAKVSRQLGLEACLIVGKGMANAAVPSSILGDVFEAIVAAMFLDSDWQTARDFVLKHIKREVEQAVETSHESNFKSQLQHHAQKFFKVSPTYVLLEESGPDHKKFFRMFVQLGERSFAAANGRNKKQAQQRAASNALAELAGETPPYTDVDDPTPDAPRSIPEIPNT
ncbi:MAG: ribonuclease III [Planctomycetaceae bacterium]|nr:ribonuclease III [Planctomycetaceae bacterium]